MDFNYDEVRRIHRLEKNSVKLVEVEQEFYNDLHSFLLSEKNDYLGSLKDLSSSKTRDFSNLKKMVEEIFALREKKLLNKALVATRTKEFDEEHMANHEKKLFKDLCNLLERHNRILDNLFLSDSDPRSDDKDLNNLSVEILSDIPEFVGTDMKEYGPFQKGVIVSLPVKIVKLLSQRKLVEVR